MVSENDQNFLFRALSANRCVLFVGAGFSREARNRLGANIPDATALSTHLWTWLGYPGAYDSSPLSEVYEAALRSGRPMAGLRQLLEDQLLATEIPDWYEIATKPYWYRIYGTNADDVVERAFEQRGGLPAVSCINAVKDDYHDRDQFLRTVQYIKLNGSLPGKPEELTFSTREYARRSAQFDRWYDHFVRDYSFHPVVFVGSELREPLFWQAVEARQARGKNPEERPRSFLVAPAVSPTKIPVLRDLNITHVPLPAEAFFTWLHKTYDFPNQVAVLRGVAPESADLVFEERFSRKERDAFADFLTAFPRVPLPPANPARPRNYFLGVAPRWEDVASDFDAPRALTKQISSSVEQIWGEKPSLSVFGIIGPAGAGKSTILMRTAFALRQGGRQVFFSEGTERPNLDSVVVALDNLGARAVLCIDNAHLLGPLIYALLRRLSTLKHPPVVILAARTNLFERQLKAIERRPDASVYEVDDLSDQEINDLLKTLERYSQLGKLAGMSEAQRFGELKVRARKQILVAMREATQGYGFDEIVRHEFLEIDNVEARILFLCAAVATAELIDLRREQWLACAEVSPAEALAVLSRNLRGMLTEDARGLIAARHPLIAELVVDRVAQRSDVGVAYVRLLNAIAHDIYKGRGRSTRTWRLFVRLIDHRRVFVRFAENLEVARSIYISVASFFQDDGHFWLQFANLEIQFGDIKNARPHLAHAESLMPDHSYVLTTKAHLNLREARDAERIEEALALRKVAEEILLEQISKQGVEDEYPYHVYVTQMLRWVEKWVTDRRAKEVELKRLDEIAQRALGYHSYSRRIRELAESARRTYLSLAVPKG